RGRRAPAAVEPELLGAPGRGAEPSRGVRSARLHPRRQPFLSEGRSGRGRDLARCALDPPSLGDPMTAVRPSSLPRATALLLVIACVSGCPTPRTEAPDDVEGLARFFFAEQLRATD